MSNKCIPHLSALDYICLPMVSSADEWGVHPCKRVYIRVKLMSNCHALSAFGISERAAVLGLRFSFYRTFTPSYLFSFALSTSRPNSVSPLALTVQIRDFHLFLRIDVQRSWNQSCQHALDSECAERINDTRSIFRSPDAFPNPEEFDPQRWIVDGQVREDIKQVVYGFSRRYGSSCVLVLG